MTIPFADLPFTGPVEVDETAVGGKERNKHADKKLHAGRGSVGKAIVAGIRDRRTGNVKVQHVDRTDAATLQGFVRKHTLPSATVYTDEHKSYEGMPFEHEAVTHSVGEYVRGEAHTNGVESFWAMLKRGLIGTYHNISKTHLHRYVNEFSGRANMRMIDTLDQIAQVATNMIGKRLRYRDLIA